MMNGVAPALGRTPESMGWVLTAKGPDVMKGIEAAKAQQSTDIARLDASVNVVKMANNMQKNLLDLYG